MTTERLHFGNVTASFVTHSWQLVTKSIRSQLSRTRFMSHVMTLLNVDNLPVFIDQSPRVLRLDESVVLTQDESVLTHLHPQCTTGSHLSQPTSVTGALSHHTALLFPFCQEKKALKSLLYQ